MSQVYCILDYETRSKADLKKVGGYEYARHPSTRVLCVAWRIGTEDELRRQLADRAKYPAKRWSPAIPAPYGELKRALLDPSVKLVAHNAFFEQMITRFVLSQLIADPYLKELDHDRWICTASMARALALPGKLAEACAALHLPIQKDAEGHRLMLKMSKPRKPTKHNRAVWHKKLSDLNRVIDYCATDVDAETSLFLSAPKLSAAERRVWLLDQKINLRGFRCDRPLVKKTLRMIAEEMKRFEGETRRITQGVVTSTAQRDATLRFLAENGLHLPNLQKKTVEDCLASDMASGKALDLLLVRQAASKSSTAKYGAFEARSRTDGRVRDNLVYHVASTGRFGGSGVQPHNFPDPKKLKLVDDTDYAAEVLSDPDTDLELIRLLWGDPLAFFASLLRSMLIPSHGRRLLGGDFAGIEVRVLFWVANYEAGLAAFRNGKDLYVELAKIIFGNPKITKATHPLERDLGKRAILGCGFGMGKDKFFETCKAQGQEVTIELAEKAVKAYRSEHSAIPALWRNLERAAIAAVQNRGKKYTLNRTSWWVEGKFLYCELPSGRRLAYYGPEIRYKPTPWGEMRPVLYHWDVHPKTKKWVLTGTYGGRLTENVVQAIARDLMVQGMIRSEDAGYEILITVHDELLGERTIGVGSVEEFEKIMAQIPEWARGLPVKVEAWEGPRYKK